MRTLTVLFVFATVSIHENLAQSHKAQQFCVPIRTMVADEDSRSNLPISQGPPGQPGSVGPQGAKGDRGADGECLCNVSEDEQLNKDVMKMEKTLDNLERVAKKANYYEFCAAGVSDGRIPDSAMTASSSATEELSAYQARLGSDTYWSPTYPSPTYDDEWLQVDMNKPTRIVGVVTQGRPPEINTYDRYTTRYKILHGNSTTAFYPIQHSSTRNDTVFDGNTDRNSYKLNKFFQPITARYFRFKVVGYYGLPALRLEYLVC